MKEDKYNLNKEFKGENHIQNSIQNESEITNYPNVFENVFIEIENILSKPDTNYFKGDNRAYIPGPVSA